MDRREFMRSAAAAAAAGIILPDALRAAAPSAVADPIGVQLFSIPKLLEQDFGKGIAMLGALGYKEVELFGPFPFSDPKAIASWSAVTPQLGFSGSGFFGRTAQQVRAALDANGITAPSVHTDFDTLLTRMDRLAEAAQVIGYRYVGLPSIPDDKRRTLDDYRRMADTFNRIGADAKRHGLRFAYHNHGYGLQPMQGTIPLQLLLDRTDRDLVFFEMDVYWTAAGGADPVALLRDNPGRYQLMHLKDMRERRRFRGDGGDAGQWIELFPFMVPAGDGVLDLRAIVAQARASGVAHLFVEQDMVANPDVALKRSIDFMTAL